MTSWIDAAEALALGELGMLPWVFWRLSPWEWTLLWEGHARRRRRRWWQLAVMATWMVAPWTKTPPKAETLLGWPHPYRED